MPTSQSEPSPTENPLLNKLKERWEAGDFTTDKDSVYGVDEAIESATEQLGDGLPRRGTGPIGPDNIIPDTINSFEDFISQELAKAQVEKIDSEFSPPKQDPPPNYKMCNFCERINRNNPCDNCYNMIRSAAEFIPTDHILTKEDLHPCVICEESETLTTICITCMNALLE